MSESTIEDNNKSLSFEESIITINDKYLNLLNDLIEKFKYHNELIGPLESDLKLTKEKLPLNKFQVIDTITDNFLFCLEQINDHNADYFIYQKEKIPKKNGKVYKNKLPKIGNRTLLKRLLKESDNKYTDKIFLEIIDIFNILTVKDESNNYIFKEEYVNYVKENFNENKNFSKMIMVFDNINNILNSKLEENNENEVDDESESFVNKEDTKKGTSKNKKKNKKNNKSSGGDFMKNLENTKIAQLAKNISEKINIDEFPALSDPSKLLSSLGNNSTEDGGIQNLLKFVVGEVEQAFKSDNLNEKDLMGEAQNIMGQFKNMSGFDPLSLLNNNKDNIDFSQFANIFSNIGK